MIQNGPPRWRRPGFSSTTSSSRPCQDLAGLSFVIPGIVGLACIYPLRFPLCDTRRLCSALHTPAICSHQRAYLSLLDKHWPNSKSRARTRGCLRRACFLEAGWRSSSECDGPSNRWNYCSYREGGFRLWRSAPSREGCCSRTACPTRTARVIPPSETVTCVLTRRHDLKLTVGKPKGNGFMS